uniref:Uncharacterized protein n=1 Tax=Opuntia streptacantha TaxID=393608 RepID=A0A7C9CH77_OPUST
MGGCDDERTNFPSAFINDSSVSGLESEGGGDWVRSPPCSALVCILLNRQITPKLNQTFNDHHQSRIPKNNVHTCRSWCARLCCSSSSTSLLWPWFFSASALQRRLSSICVDASAAAFNSWVDSAF